MQKYYHFVWSFILLEHDYLISQSTPWSSVPYVTENLCFSALLHHTFTFSSSFLLSTQELPQAHSQDELLHLPSLLKSLPKPRLWSRRGQECIRCLCGMDWMSVPQQWGHFSRQPRLVSSSSTIRVLCNVRESPITDIILVSQMKSLLSQVFCVTALPVYLPDITRARCHHH